MDATSTTAVVIPSLEPARDLLLPFLEQLHATGFRYVVLVDDGSPDPFRPIFDEAADRFGCHVLRHPVNMGKGRALKTAFEHCHTLPGLTAVVTADADGQHSPDDILAVAQRLTQVDARTAVFGSRDFTGAHVPKNSRRGNSITSRVVRVLFGQYVSDTQTGLRGFPLPLAMESTSVRGERFEYEMNVVLWLIGNHVTIDEIPIQTIYHDLDNSVSHFRPLQDSARIYATIFKQFALFLVSSVLGALLDIALYTAVITLFFHGSSAATGVVTSTVVARIVSSLANYVLNRRAVFEDSSSKRRSLLRYYTLAAFILACSALGTSIMSKALGGHVVWAKIIVDGCLFVVSYLVQKRWVFRDGTLQEPQ